MANKILLLAWKNLLLRKRHFIVTTFEILFPTFMVWVLVYINKKLDKGPAQNQDGVTFEAMTWDELHIAFMRAFPCLSCTFAYAPDNTQTKEVIDALSSNFTTVSGGSIDWKAFNSEKDIEAYLAEVAFDPTNFGDLEAAVVFESGLDLGVSSTSGVISYKIRLLNRILNTHLLFPILQEPGPDLHNEMRYAESGFSFMQLCIERVLAKRLTGQDFHHEVTLQAFPYPSSKTIKNFTKIYFDFLPDAIVIGFVIIVIAIAIVVVSEKETGIRELQKLNGVRGWMQWLGWMLDSILFVTISVTLVVFLLFIDFGSGALIKYGGHRVVVCVDALYNLGICFLLLSSLAITVGIILWLVTYFFPDAELHKVYDTTSLASKLAYALLPNMAIGLACRSMVASEGKAKGISWTNIWEPIKR
ncbi:ATP-binding cassette sub-family A member 3 [Orchesella cincta]|uniref:ATP-binding cassette sub-family A member 3 n=1 Tax=Orchesella cincta TaxID=48709 RepID=A0A1D2M7E8_ORCCI|nr:ATP-binding cassette sub-family A member 3 [Orchesella cincta]